MYFNQFLSLENSIAQFDCEKDILFSFTFPCLKRSTLTLLDAVVSQTSSGGPNSLFRAAKAFVNASVIRLYFGTGFIPELSLAKMICLQTCLNAS